MGHLLWLLLLLFLLFLSLFVVGVLTNLEDKRLGIDLGYYGKRTQAVFGIRVIVKGLVVMLGKWGVCCYFFNIGSISWIQEQLMMFGIFGNLWSIMNSIDFVALMRSLLDSRCLLMIWKHGQLFNVNTSVEIGIATIINQCMDIRWVTNNYHIKRFGW